MKTEVHNNINKKYISIFIGIVTFLSGTFANAQTNRSSADFLKEYLTKNKECSFFIFPQEREKPIQCFDSIPTDKLTDFNHMLPFHGQSGKFFTFQIGVLAANNNVKNVKVSFSSFTGKDKQAISVFKNDLL